MEPVVTTVCLVGSADVDLREELLDRETSRRALSSYELTVPYENAIGVSTISLGAAVSLMNDLDWYLIRFTDAALVLEPSVSEAEWLSRPLATAIRDGEVEPGETGALLKIYGIEDGALVEPMLAQRVGDAIPSYDLRDVDETLVVRVLESEFGW